MYYKEGVDTMSFSIRLTDEERKLAESYAALHSLSLGDAFKTALFDRIEDEFDVVVANEAYGEYESGGKQRRPIGEFWQELNL